MYRFLILLTIAAAIGLQLWRTLFNNFAVEVGSLEGFQVGVIQSVREVPGLLALMAVYVMLLVREHHLSALSVLLLGVGVGLTGFFPSYYGLICTTLVMSFGFHYFETTNQSLTLQYFDNETSPLVLGRQRSYSSGTNIGVGLGVMFLSGIFSYLQFYMAVGLLIVGLGVWGLFYNPYSGQIPFQTRKLVLKKKYFLFYLLTFLAGARRQIFAVFVVFFMVERLSFSIKEVTALFVLNNLINYFFCPLVGRAIVKFGERKVLSLEYGFLVIIFLAYAVVDSRILVAVLYIFDHIFYNFAIAIRTFFQRISDPGDISSSMAVGFTINHIAAVVLPALFGMLWMVDYRIPFVSGSLLAVCSLIAVQFIPSRFKRVDSS